ncbi:MAG: DUF4147 domain-containing protein [Myxococcales bacterium]|nr:DUF4147 domain-containing protein [Myxococcales bacterium]
MNWREHLLTHNRALSRHPHGRDIAAIAAAALDAVDPGACIRHHVHLLTTPAGPAVVVGESVFELRGRKIWIFGAGKASEAMAMALRERLGHHVAGGLIIGKHLVGPADDERTGVILLPGDHPIPGPQSAAAGTRLRAMAARVGPRDLVLCPISGGASALLSEPTLAPQDWATILEHLIARDVPIQMINRLRRRLDRFKAGGLARLFAPATVIGLIISDVIGDEPALIGSGPTVYADAGDDEQAHGELMSALAPKLSTLAPPLRRILLTAPTPEPAPRDPVSDRAQQVHQVLLARNGDAREAACRCARDLGWDAVVLLPALSGQAADEGRRLATILREMPPDLPVQVPACLVTGGETTVDLGEPSGSKTSDTPPVGGRNLELALAAVEGLAAQDPAPWGDAALLTLATDGEDGPTDAAGALVTAQTRARAHALGLDAQQALRTHQSYAYFEALDDLIKTGPTGTNVCDLSLCFRLR